MLDATHVAVPRLLHRRPQSARHRRGGPSRLHRSAPLIALGARRSPPIAPPRCRPRSAFGLQRPRPDRAGLARRHRAARRPRGLRRVGRDRGRPARRRRRCSPTRRAVAPVGLDSVKAAPVTADDFRVPAAGTGDAGDRRHARARSSPSGCALRPAVARRRAQARLAQDVIKVAVVARHGVNGNIGRGFVNGFGLQARRHRLLGRPRQPQHLRRRRRRRRHGRGRQPADRDRGRLRRWRRAARSWPSWRCRSPA